VTDVLDRLADPAGEMLARVDDTLMAHGLPAGHPIVDLLRRLGALPADAAHAISAQDPAPLRAAGSELRHHADGYDVRLDTAPGWEGPAADGYAAGRSAVQAHLAGSADRLRATAAYLDDVADWIDASRRALAYALADALGSEEAVRLRDRDVEAAATIGARILRAVDEAHEAGRDLARRWAGRLDEVPYDSGPGPGSPDPAPPRSVRASR
jgi:hypothetical protein